MVEEKQGKWGGRGPPPAHQLAVGTLRSLPVGGWAGGTSSRLVCLQGKEKVNPSGSETPFIPMYSRKSEMQWTMWSKSWVHKDRGRGYNHGEEHQPAQQTRNSNLGVPRGHCPPQGVPRAHLAPSRNIRHPSPSAAQNGLQSTECDSGHLSLLVCSQSLWSGSVGHLGCCCCHPRALILRLQQPVLTSSPVPCMISSGME